jgi:WXG100 family type VII secretion target
MRQPIRVNPQELADAAELIRGYAAQLRAGHGPATAAAKAAQSGLVGKSAQSIGVKTQRWQAVTAELQRVLDSQADALASVAKGYADTEAYNHRAITVLGDSVDPTSL